MNPNQPNPNEQPEQDTNPFASTPANSPVTSEQTTSPIQPPAPETNPTPQFQQPVAPAAKKNPIKKWIITGATAVAVFVGGAAIQYISGQLGSAIVDGGPGAMSNKEYIENAVATAKASTTLPTKVDSVTTLQDIKASDEAILYTYLLNDVDPAEFDSDKLRASILSGVCKNVDTKAMLDRGILMKYDYEVQNYTETYSITVSKNDCP